MRRRPRVHFSFRSPYSWMSLELLVRQHPELHETCDLIPFWDPEPRTEDALRSRGGRFHYVQMSKAKHLYILHDTKRLASRLGLTMAWPIDRDPRWEVPHLAWLAAQRLGRGVGFYRAVVAARWVRGEDICEPEVVAALGADVGLDGAVLAGSADDPDIRDEAVDCLLTAYHDDIFGVPYFRVGHHRFWGFDRVGEFLAELRGDPPGTGRGPAPALAARLADAVGSYDTDTAGGCG